MKNWNDETHLECIEALANENGWISNEDELSELFDSEIAPSIISEYGEDDEPAINEGFNNWSDSLCKNGDIHPLQYNQYCYTGDYS